MIDKSMFDGKSILVTGACGTIGKELVMRSLALGASRVVVAVPRREGVHGVIPLYHYRGQGIYLLAVQTSSDQR